MVGTIAFGVAAACALASALFVVRARDLVHAVLWLAAALLATAALYAMLGASFLAGVQALVYVGGVVTLMIFGVMVTRRHDGAGASIESVGAARGAIVAVAFFAVIAGAILKTPGLDAAVDAPPANGAADLGRALLRAHVLAFEVTSLLLLAAIVGAIVIARRRDPIGAPRPAPAPEGAAREVIP